MQLNLCIGVVLRNESLHIHNFFLPEWQILYRNFISNFFELVMHGKGRYFSSNKFFMADSRK
jgi:hypothetical protein